MERFERAGLDEIVARVALRRLGTVEDCARVVEFLATDLSDYITGAVVPIDGGSRAGPAEGDALNSGPRPFLPSRPRRWTASSSSRRVSGPAIDVAGMPLYDGHIDVTTETRMQDGIGVRALRDGLTRHLARVRRGARLLITDRGTPIAVLAPYEASGHGELASRLAAILSSGHVNPAARPFRADPPLVRGRGKRASQVVSEGRR